MLRLYYQRVDNTHPDLIIWNPYYAGSCTFALRATSPLTRW